MTQGTAVGRQRRVVSLVPSITETLLSWGVVPVGVTRFCDLSGVPGVAVQPPELRRVDGSGGIGGQEMPQGSPKVTVIGGTKNPDVAAIAALEPDAVLMDREENRLEDADSLAAAGLNVVATAVRSLDDVRGAVDLLAAQAGVPEKDRHDHLEWGSTPRATARLRVFVPIWRRPWMTINADTYGGSVLEAAGLVNVFADESQRYPSVELAQAAESGADAVLAPSEPYPFKERHRAELERVAPVEFVDGRDLFWWGSRTASAVVRLAALARRLEDR